jgi:hypothetical protein
MPGTWSYNGLPVELHPLTDSPEHADRPHPAQFGVCGYWWLPSAPGLSSDTPAWFWGFGLKVAGPAIERRALGHVSVFGFSGDAKMTPSVAHGSTSPWKPDWQLHKAAFCGRLLVEPPSR